jgi:hypothetical protein
LPPTLVLVSASGVLTPGASLAPVTVMLSVLTALLVPSVAV